MLDLWVALQNSAEVAIIGAGRASLHGIARSTSFHYTEPIQPEFVPAYRSRRWRRLLTCSAFTRLINGITLPLPSAAPVFYRFDAPTPCHHGHDRKTNRTGRFYNIVCFHDILELHCRSGGVQAEHVIWRKGFSFLMQLAKNGVMQR